METRANQIRQLEATDYSSEKAGVGGSIPSLATMFSIAYSHPQPRVCSNNKFRLAGVRLCASKMVLSGSRPIRFET